MHVSICKLKTNIATEIKSWLSSC